MDRQVRVVLELKLLLLLPCHRNLLIVLGRVRLSGGHLLRLKALLVAAATWWLVTLALTHGIFLRLLEFTAIHVL